MSAAFYVAVKVVFLAALPAAAIVENGRMVAEIGVHDVEVHVDSADPVLMRSAAASLAALADATDKWNAYQTAIFEDHPVAYWDMAETGGKVEKAKSGAACGTSWPGPNGPDLCQVDAEVHPADSADATSGGMILRGATSLIKSGWSNSAAVFDGSSQLVIPSSSFINSNRSGYTQRTVELWFSAGEIGAIGRSIFMQGSGADTGISLTAAEVGHGGHDSKLSMYAWDRTDGSVLFGTDAVAAEPITCGFAKNSAIYAALVFDSEARKVAGYIRRPDGSVQKCGKDMDLPTGAKLNHMGYDEKAVIGGLHKGTARLTGTTEMQGSGHEFIGSIDEVAIYDAALSMDKLQAHVDAAVAAGSADST